MNGDKLFGFLLFLCVTITLQHEAYPPGVPNPNMRQGQGHVHQQQQNLQYQGQGQHGKWLSLLKDTVVDIYKRNNFEQK